MGKTRAKQYALLKSMLPSSPATSTSSVQAIVTRDGERPCELGDRVMCVQLHGDASFTGQGVVMESLGLSAYVHLSFGVRSVPIYDDY